MLVGRRKLVFPSKNPKCGADHLGIGLENAQHGYYSCISVVLFLNGLMFSFLKITWWFQAQDPCWTLSGRVKTFVLSDDWSCGVATKVRYIGKREGIKSQIRKSKKAESVLKPERESWVLNGTTT